MQPIQQGYEFSLPNVLGDFYIENYHYLIICLEHPFEPSKEHDLKSSPTRFTDSAVGQLKMHGKECVIVEVEDFPAKGNNSEMITLLTERELQIVQLIAQGCSNKQIAHRLQISEWTVATHLRRVFAKLGVDSRAAMVYRCSSLLNN
jgi:DNA-binding CsgD family transcriptional regulator